MPSWGDRVQSLAAIGARSQTARSDRDTDKCRYKPKAFPETGAAGNKQREGLLLHKQMRSGEAGR